MLLGVILIFRVSSSQLVTQYLPSPPGMFYFLIQLGFIIVGGLFGYLIALLLISEMSRISEAMESGLRKTYPGELAAGGLGMLAGLLIAFILSRMLLFLGESGRYVSLLLALVFSYLGYIVGSREGEILISIGRRRAVSDKTSTGAEAYSKILDTSVIIDGRIADVYQTGFVEGNIIIPRFVLQELQHIADSSDTLKRSRGRRGLDILNRMRKTGDSQVKISEQDFEEIREVDAKLVKLAKVINAKIVTNDYNLNKVAELQGIKVLNVNELANAVKPLVLPSEEMVVHVLKEGKEANQGVAYLDDGTMVVIDDGKRYIGETIDVVVTSVLQTTAGRMVFARVGPNEI